VGNYTAAILIKENVTQLLKGASCSWHGSATMQHFIVHKYRLK
jgi:hypothetical protein